MVFVYGSLFESSVIVSIGSSFSKLAKVLRFDFGDIGGAAMGR